MKPSKSNTGNSLAIYDLVVGVSKGKVVVLKDRDGTFPTELSISEAICSIMKVFNKKFVNESLKKLISKIEVYETFR